MRVFNQHFTRWLHCCVYAKLFYRGILQRYLVLSGAIWSFFRPGEATRCTDGGDIWSGDIPRRLSSPSVHGRGVGAKNAKFYLHFTKFRNINASHRRLSCMIFTKFSPIGELLAGSCVKTRGQWRRQGEGEKGKLPPYGWTSKNYVICVCFHCHGTSSYHTTNTLHGRRANKPRWYTDNTTGTGGLRTLDPL